MATVITEGDAFAPSVTAPDDADPLNAASVVAPGVGFQALADRTRNLALRCGGTTGIPDEFQYLDAAGAPTPKTRVRVFNAAVAQPTSAQIANPPGWYFSLGQWWSTLVDFPQLVLPLGALLPNQCLVTLVRVMVQTGAARPVVNDRMKLQIQTQTNVDFSAPGIPTYTTAVDQADDGNVGNQVISSGAIAGVIDRTPGGGYVDVIAKVIGGNDSGTNRDDVFAFEVTYLDFGPQNF